MPCSFQQMQGASGLCQPQHSGALLQQGLSAWLCPLPSTDAQPFLLPPHQAVAKLHQWSPMLALSQLFGWFISCPGCLGSSLHMPTSHPCSSSLMSPERLMSGYKTQQLMLKQLLHSKL